MKSNAMLERELRTLSHGASESWLRPGPASLTPHLPEIGSQSLAGCPLVLWTLLGFSIPFSPWLLPFRSRWWELSAFCHCPLLLQGVGHQHREVRDESNASWCLSGRQLRPSSPQSGSSMVHCAGNSAGALQQTYCLCLSIFMHWNLNGMLFGGGAFGR